MKNLEINIGDRIITPDGYYGDVIRLYTYYFNDKFVDIKIDSGKILSRAVLFCKILPMNDIE